jgi:hypothetical protein
MSGQRKSWEHLLDPRPPGERHALAVVAPPPAAAAANTMVSRFTTTGGAPPAPAADDVSCVSLPYKAAASCVCASAGSRCHSDLTLDSSMCATKYSTCVMGQGRVWVG